MRRIYIAGPMRGRPENNVPAFNQAAERFADAGAILEQIVSSVAPPPELGMKPALWDINAHERRRIAERLDWPWERAAHDPEAQ